MVDQQTWAQQQEQQEEQEQEAPAGQILPSPENQ
jgi:hypothetical protein